MAARTIEKFRSGGIEQQAMNDLSGHFTGRRLLGFICFILLCGILYAGLHPFHIPANQVTWIAGANGLHFGEHGAVFGLGKFLPPANDERTIEIWAKPGLIKDSNTLLAFYSPAAPGQLWLSQRDSDLKIQTQPSSAWRSFRPKEFYIENAFLDGRNAFWTIAFGKSGTAVYRNGVLTRRSSLKLSASELSGQLIVGNSPIFHESWSGVLRGLAIYDKELAPAQVERHYASWRDASAPTLTSDDACAALYIFNEHSGNIVHNRIRPGNELYIPSRFGIRRQTLLDPVWRAFNWSWSFWEDTSINVAGFIPFTFFFCAWFSSRHMHSAALKASLFGAGISVLIEVTQAYLPTRDSSMSDVITNALGSALGAMAYRGTPARILQDLLLRAVKLLNWQ